MRRILFLILLLAITAVALPPKKRTSTSVRRQQQQTEQQIRRTQQSLEANQARAEANLAALNALNADIQRQEELIRATSDSITLIERNIVQVADSIDSLERKVGRMRATYREALRTARSGRLDPENYALIFSGTSITQALSRYRYLRVFARWLSDNARRLNEATDRLRERRARLDGLRTLQHATMERMTAARDMLLAQQAAIKVLVDELNADRKALNNLLARQREEARRLDNELTRLIEEETRRAEEEARKAAEEEARRAAAAQQTHDAKPEKTDGKKTKTDNSRATAPAKPAAPSAVPAQNVALSGTFEKNKGKLPAPVSGRYKIVKPFGVTKHPSLSGVLVENSGIDMEVDTGASAKAVFDGEVTVVFRPSGYQNVVVVRHGKYLTVYGGLETINVAKGDKVKVGQQLGTVYANPADGGRSILHFEVRNGRDKLDPVGWIR